MKTTLGKRLSAVLSAAVFLSLAGVSESAFAAESFKDTSYADITVFPDIEICKVSPYIYGINDIGDISGVKAEVIKQTGPFLSSYNWENNASNSFVDGRSVNRISFADPESDEKYTSPAMYSKLLTERAEALDIPKRLVTLQMMGYVANDADGPISESETGFSDRWAAIKYNEDFSYTNKPNKKDGIVYVDEYAAFLANNYGTASEGGIMGYFLDTEPDKWAMYYPMLDKETTMPDPAEFIERSVELSSHVKVIDDTALIFAPSLGGIAACADFCGNYRSRTGSFADYYLYGMKKASDEEGIRLLDVFDIHYFAEYGRTVNDVFLSEDAFIMERTRALYDETYFDNSLLCKEYGEYVPVIKKLRESIDRSYPGTKLSFSEYNFGGGDRMSGCIAEIDALGAFASNGVFLACLYPDEINSYQKAGLNIYTNYDKAGSGVGDTAVRINCSDNMSVAYAFTDGSASDTVWVVLANKNLSGSKTFAVKTASDRHFDAAEMYTVGGFSSEIVRNREELPEMSENSLTVSLPERSACLLVLKTNDMLSEGDNTVTDATYTEPPEATDNTFSDAADDDPDRDGVSDGTVTDAVFTAQTVPTVRPDGTELYFETGNKTHDPEGIAESSASDASDGGGREFPFALKIIAVIAAVGCIIGIVYVIFIDK